MYSFSGVVPSVQSHVLNSLALARMASVDCCAAYLHRFKINLSGIYLGAWIRCRYSFYFIKKNPVNLVCVFARISEGLKFPVATTQSWQGGLWAIFSVRLIPSNRKEMRTTDDAEERFCLYSYLSVLQENGVYPTPDQMQFSRKVKLVSNR